MRLLKQSHSAKKFEKGDPLGCLKLQFVAKYQKIEGGDKKNGKKVAQFRKKSKGDPTVSSGFLSYGKIEINERGPFAVT